jgi:chromate transporter
MDTKILRKSLRLFKVFFRIGMFTFGGGFAMIPYIEKEIVEKNKWIESDDIIDIFAVVQSLPGVIAVNSSTFVGYKIAGLTGAFAATLGVILPSYIIIAIIALLFYNFRHYPFVNEAFYGIQAGVAALMCHVVYKLSKSSLKNGFAYALAIVAFLVLTVFGAPAIGVLLAAGVIGLVVSTLYKTKDSREAK